MDGHAVRVQLHIASGAVFETDCLFCVVELNALTVWSTQGVTSYRAGFNAGVGHSIGSIHRTKNNAVGGILGTATNQHMIANVRQGPPALFLSRSRSNDPHPSRFQAIAGGKRHPNPS